MSISEQQLKAGHIFKFEGGDAEDDFRVAEVSFVDHGARNSWATGFKIWFNGKLIHSSKTFKAVEKRLNKLIADWALELAE